MGKKQSNLVVTKDLLKNGWKVAGIFLATRVCPTWQGVLPFETSAFCCLFKTHFTPNAPPPPHPPPPCFTFWALATTLDLEEQFQREEELASAEINKQKYIFNFIWAFILL